MAHPFTIDSNPCISKVRVGLIRNVKPADAYKPILVSIGPYHNNHHDLEAMQKQKEEYLNLLKQREPQICDLKSPYFEKGCDYYEDHINNAKFADMMLLDGCFIVEFLRKMDNEVKGVTPDKKDPIFRVPYMQIQIKCDMLLENQIPYFVLSEVYNKTRYAEEKALEEMVMSVFNIMLPRPRLNSNNVVENINTEKINHLLHLIHVFYRPFPEKPITNSIPIPGEIPVQMTCLSSFAKKVITKICDTGESSNDQAHCPLLPQNRSCNDKSKEKLRGQMDTVIELQEAGVKFEKVGEVYNGILKSETKDDYVSLFDIKLEGRVMKIPCFKVDDSTETLLRNLIAFEQQHFKDYELTQPPYKKVPSYFTEFALLMNQLINSKEDTKALRSKKIVMNMLGSDDELSNLFNRLTDGVIESSEPYYLEVHKKVDEHCKKKCNIAIANFRRKYFSINHPWALVSAIAAAILLLLTVGQLVVAIISLFV